MVRASIRLLAFVAILSSAWPALALKCPEPPEAARRDITNDLRIALGGLWKLRIAELDNKTEVVPRSIYERTTAPEKLYFAELSTSVFCGLLNDAKEMPEREKIDKYMIFQSKLADQLSRTASSGNAETKQQNEKKK